MNKLIGIPGWKCDDKYFGLPLAYIEYFSRFGNVRILTPLDQDVMPLDLLVLPGGLDINPSTYGNVPHYYTQNSNVILEHFDKEILPKYLQNDTPIFGICRGAQRLWTMYGGKLNQHWVYHPRSSHNKDQCHKLYFEEQYSELCKMVDNVTSRHHQICVPTDGIELEVIAYAGIEINKKVHKDENVVEAFVHSNKRIVGVQYHPEDHDFSDEFTPYLINDLLSN